MTIWINSLFIIDYFIFDENDHHTLTQICRNAERVSDRSPSIFANIVGFGYIGAFIMLYLNANNFIKKRSNKNGQIPVCYGRFQRNVLTFKQTLIFGGLNSIFSCRTSMFILLKKQFGIVLNHKYYFYVSNIFILDFLIYIVFPLYILFFMYRKVPDFYKNSNSSNLPITVFYINTPTFVPRRPSVQSSTLLRNFIQSQKPLQNSQKCRKYHFTLHNQPSSFSMPQIE